MYVKVNMSKTKDVTLMLKHILNFSESKQKSVFLKCDLT